MQFQYLATSLAVFVAASAQNTTDTTFNFNCSSLTPPFSSSGEAVLEFNYTAPSPVTYRVSEAVICPSNATVNDTNCLIEAAGRISVHATTNITEISDVSALKSLLRRALESSGAVRSELDIDMYLEDRVFDGLPRTHYVKPGEAAYFAFTPSMRCFNGTISTIPTCAELDETVRRTADTFNGKGLNVCIPVLRKAIKRTSKVEGSLGVVVISEEEARREGMSTNPADPNRGNSSDDKDDGVTRDPPGTVVGASARLDAGIFGTVAVALLALHMGNMA